MNDRAFHLTPISTHPEFWMGWGGTHTVEPFWPRLSFVCFKEPPPSCNWNRDFKNEKQHSFVSDQKLKWNDSTELLNVPVCCHELEEYWSNQDPKLHHMTYHQHQQLSHLTNIVKKLNCVLGEQKSVCCHVPDLTPPLRYMDLPSKHLLHGKLISHCFKY